MIVGKITKLFGDKGAVVVRLYDEWEDEMANDVLWIVIDSLRIPIYIYSIERRGNNGAVIKFDDLDNKRRAEYVIDKKLEFDECTDDQTDDDHIYISDMIGWSVGFEGRDEKGVVKDFIDDDKNPLFIISVNNFEVLIPAIDEFILETGDKNVVFTLPEGLFELYEQNY